MVYAVTKLCNVNVKKVGKVNNAILQFVILHVRTEFVVFQGFVSVMMDTMVNLAAKHTLNVNRVIHDASTATALVEFANVWITTGVRVVKMDLKMKSKIKW